MIDKLLQCAIVFGVTVACVVGLSLGGLMLIMTYDMGATVLAKHYCPSPR